MAKVKNLNKEALAIHEELQILPAKNIAQLNLAACLFSCWVVAKKSSAGEAMRRNL